MWLFTQNGFIAVCSYNPQRGQDGGLPGWLDDWDRRSIHERALEGQDRDAHDSAFLLRARRREALDWALRSPSRVWKAPIGEVFGQRVYDAGSNADYRYRLLLPRMIFWRVFAALFESVAYDSLKAGVLETGDVEYYKLLQVIHRDVEDFLHEPLPASTRRDDIS